MKPGEHVFSNHKEQRLYADFYKASDSRNVVIVSHGFTGSKDEDFLPRLCINLKKQGVNAFALDYSGHGKSEGKFKDITFTGQIKELQKAIDYLYNKGFTSIGLIGHSQGGAISLLTAVRDERTDFLVSLAGVAYTQNYYDLLEDKGASRKELEEKGWVSWQEEREDGIHEFTLKKEFYDDATSYRPVEEIKKLDIPVLFLHGSKDELVAEKDSEDLYRNASCPRELIAIPGADHNFLGKEDRMIKEVTLWIKEHQNADT